MTLVTRTALAGCGMLLALGCGDPTPIPNTAPPTSQRAPLPDTPSSVGTTAAPEVRSSVRTQAPSAATGCPATDPASLVAPGTVHDRGVQANETWTLEGSPHRLPDGLTIANGAVLTIAPCVRVIVGDAQWITVEDGGTLVAAGQPAKPIVFDSSATSEVRGLWQGIMFQGNARPTSKLHHVVIEEAGGDPGYPGAIHLDGDFVLDAQHVQVVRAKRHGVMLRGTSRFAPTSTDLVVRSSGIAEELSVPVLFESANAVGSLPEGRYEENVTNEIVVEGKDVTASATWRNPGIRYRLQDGLVVEGPTGAVLTIAPGTTLAFAAGKTLWVGWNADGAVVLDGGADATRIVLTSARPVPDVGDWAGVLFGEHVSGAATKLAFVTIAYAGGTDGYDDVGCGDPIPAAITMWGRDLGRRIDHVKLEHMAPTSVAFARNYNTDEPTDYTEASLGNDLGGGQRCKQTLNRRADGSCPDPVPACR